jgi:hypothetical protein
MPSVAQVPDKDLRPRARCTCVHRKSSPLRTRRRRLRRTRALGASWDRGDCAASAPPAAAQEKGKGASCPLERAALAALRAACCGSSYRRDRQNSWICQARKTRETGQTDLKLALLKNAVGSPVFLAPHNADGGATATSRGGLTGRGPAPDLLPKPHSTSANDASATKSSPRVTGLRTPCIRFMLSFT